MQPISDAFLLTMAGLSASLVGLFLIGMFFFINTGFRRMTDDREGVERYFRSGTRITLVDFAIAIFLSLSLVALDPVWSRVLFLVLSLLLIAANVDSAIRVRPIARSYGMLELAVNEVLGTIGVLILVTVPWILGGFNPTREDFTWAILTAFLIGFTSFGALVLSAFHLAPLDTDGIVEHHDQPRPAETGPITESQGVMDQNGDDPEDLESEPGDHRPVT